MRESVFKNDLELGGAAGNWYAVQAKCRVERRIAQDLSAKGFQTYLPLLREERQWSDRKKVLDVPAFSGYVFVRQDGSLASRVRVLETFGVLRMLGDNHSPTPVPEREIQSLRVALERGVNCHRFDSIPVGSRVEVKHGPLAGVFGQLVRVSRGFRLVLSVSTVSQAIAVEVDLDDVELEAPRKQRLPEFSGNLGPLPVGADFVELSRLER